jgi:hypothetical protein
MADVGSVVRATEMIAGLGVALSSAETLTRTNRAGDTPWNSWDVLSLRHRVTSTGRTGLVAAALLHGRAQRYIVAASVMAALTIVAGVLPAVAHTAMLSLLAALLVLRSFRTPYGGEGSDQVFVAVLGSMTVATLAGRPEYAIFFIAAQSCLAYFVSGVTKLAHPGWRDGSFLLGVMGTRTWGSATLHRHLNASRTACARLSVAMISAEALFPLVLLAPTWSVPWILASAGVFHLAVAVVMGLNCFSWAFVSTYPSVVYVAAL